jgi:hypothetical protein
MSSFALPLRPIAGAWASIRDLVAATAAIPPINETSRNFLRVQ